MGRRARSPARARAMVGEMEAGKTATAPTSPFRRRRKGSSSPRADQARTPIALTPMMMGKPVKISTTEAVAREVAGTPASPRVGSRLLWRAGPASGAGSASGNRLDSAHFPSLGCRRRSVGPSRCGRSHDPLMGLEPTHAVSVLPPPDEDIAQLREAASKEGTVEMRWRNRPKRGRNGTPGR
jgi:hypothetical protein